MGKKGKKMGSNQKRENMQSYYVSVIGHEFLTDTFFNY